MAHFLRELTDAAWYHYRTVPASVIRNIDEKTKKAVSGTGGTWNPSSAIIIGGAGLELQCMARLTNAKAQPGTGKVFRFGDGDYFTHASPVARVIRQSPLEALSGFASFQAEAQAWMDNALSVTPTLLTMRQGAFVRVPLRIPDGSVLTQLVIGFKVGQSHANVPQHLPRARVVRISKDGTIAQFPSPSAPADSAGWHVPATPANGAAWYASGALQTLTLGYNGVEKTDSSLYGYAVEWKEERGTNAFTDELGNHLVYFEMTVSQADLRPY